MYHVYSTLSNSTRYVKYRESPQNEINLPERSVLIKGGHGVHQKTIGTPMGVYNSVSEDDMAWLEEDPSFRQHVDHGYINVQKRSVNPEVAAADMVTRDQKTDACPIIPQQFKQDGDRETIKPVAGKKSA